MNVIFKIHQIIRIRKHSLFYLNNADSIKSLNSDIDIQISIITYDNVDRVVDFRTINHVASFRKLLSDGQCGVFAWKGEKVVGHGWAKVCSQRHCRVNGYFDIKQNEALIHNCNVSERFRGKNIYPHMLAFLCNLLFSSTNVKRIIIDTEFDNIASQNGIVKVGFKPLGFGVYLQLMGRCIFKHETLQESDFNKHGH